MNPARGAPAPGLQGRPPPPHLGWTGPCPAWLPDAFSSVLSTPCTSQRTLFFLQVPATTPPPGRLLCPPCLSGQCSGMAIGTCVINTAVTLDGVLGSLRPLGTRIASPPQTQFLVCVRGLLYGNSINLEDENYEISIRILFFLYQISKIRGCRCVQQISTWLCRLALSCPGPCVQGPASRFTRGFFPKKHYPSCWLKARSTWLAVVPVFISNDRRIPAASQG